MAVILHADLDAFFASCELRRRDAEAIVVCIYSDRGGDAGAVSAADYAARDLGIHAGMPIRQAKNIAADADREVTFLDADHEYYREISERIMAMLADAAQDIEVASIDEAYADLSGNTYAEATEMAEALRERVRTELDVTMSAGIAPNKLVAKMASDADKPDGLTVVEPDEIRDFLDPRPVEELHGVGPRTAEALADMGVETIADLRSVTAPRLVDRFGEAKGTGLYRKARGEGATALSHEDRKQLSRMTTLEEDTRSMADIRPVLRDLAGDVMERVEDRGVRFGRAATIVVTADRDTHTRSTTFKAPVRDGERLIRTVEDLVETFLDGTDTDLRRLGVRVGALEEGGQRTLEAF